MRYYIALSSIPSASSAAAAVSFFTTCARPYGNTRCMSMYVYDSTQVGMAAGSGFKARDLFAKVDMPGSYSSAVPFNAMLGLAYEENPLAPPVALPAVPPTPQPSPGTKGPLCDVEEATTCYDPHTITVYLPDIDPVLVTYSLPLTVSFSF